MGNFPITCREAGTENKCRNVAPMFFALLITLLLVGCISPATFLGGADVADHGSGTDLGFVCEEVLQHLKAAKQIVSQISSFTWAEFTTLGVVLPPPGVCATGTTYLAEKNSVPIGLGWMPLTDKLSFRATADNLAVVCDNCLSLAGKVCLADKGLPLDERQELWYQLDSALTGAVYLVSAHKDVVAHQVVPETESQFGRSSDDIRKKYGYKFKAWCDQYFILLDGLQYHLEKAKQTASIMSREQDEVYR